jgi:hypothetical protein
MSVGGGTGVAGELSAPPFRGGLCHARRYSSLPLPARHQSCQFRATATLPRGLDLVCTIEARFVSTALRCRCSRCRAHSDWSGALLAPAHEVMSATRCRLLGRQALRGVTEGAFAGRRFIKPRSRGGAFAILRDGARSGGGACDSESAGSRALDHGIVTCGRYP